MLAGRLDVMIDTFGGEGAQVHAEGSGLCHWRPSLRVLESVPGR
jgi:hypothetical protein